MIFLGRMKGLRIPGRTNAWIKAQVRKETICSEVSSFHHHLRCFKGRAFQAHSENYSSLSSIKRNLWSLWKNCTYASLRESLSVHEHSEGSGEFWHGQTCSSFFNQCFSPPPFKSLSIHCNFEEHNFGNISQYHGVGCRSVTFLVRRRGDDLERLWVQEFVLYEQAFGSHSGFLAWKNPWTEEPGRLLSIGSRESNLT